MSNLPHEPEFEQAYNGMHTSPIRRTKYIHEMEKETN